MHRIATLPTPQIEEAPKVPTTAKPNTQILEENTTAETSNVDDDDFAIECDLWYPEDQVTIMLSSAF